MPIYEYLCRSCGRRFEELVLGNERPDCPGCSGRDLQKLWSAFAVGGPAADPPPGSCGTCGDPRGPGACAADDR
jgi:putative FmdB family regulatory protein